MPAMLRRDVRSVRRPDFQNHRSGIRTPADESGPAPAVSRFMDHGRIARHEPVTVVREDSLQNGLNFGRAMHFGCVARFGSSGARFTERNCGSISMVEARESRFSRQGGFRSVTIRRLVCDDCGDGGPGARHRQSTGRSSQVLAQVELRAFERRVSEPRCSGHKLGNLRYAGRSSRCP